MYHYKLNYKINFNIVADRYDLIYFNTPKNANSTMKAQFVDVLGMAPTKYFPLDVHHAYEFPTATEEEVRSKYQDYLKFLIVRNPWDRLVSCYQSKIRKSCSLGPDYILESHPKFYIGMPFEEFVDLVCAIPDSDADYHFCSQTYMMLYSDGYCPINYFCNMDNLSNHIDDLRSITGAPFSGLGNVNPSEHSSYVDYYTPELIEKVRQRYEADIALFRYEFGRENTLFPFGAITEEFKQDFADSSFLHNVVQEKNRELLKTLNSRPDLEQALNQIRQLKKELEIVKNSRSWKVTKPLRNIWSYFETRDPQ